MKLIERAGIDLTKYDLRADIQRVLNKCRADGNIDIINYFSTSVKLLDAFGSNFTYLLLDAIRERLNRFYNNHSEYFYDYPVIELTNNNGYCFLTYTPNVKDKYRVSVFEECISIEKSAFLQNNLDIFRVSFSGTAISAYTIVGIFNLCEYLGSQLALQFFNLFKKSIRRFNFNHKDSSIKNIRRGEINVESSGYGYGIGCINIPFKFVCRNKEVAVRVSIHCKLYTLRIGFEEKVVVDSKAVTSRVFSPSGTLRNYDKLLFSDVIERLVKLTE